MFWAQDRYLGAAPSLVPASELSRPTWQERP